MGTVKVAMLMNGSRSEPDGPLSRRRPIRVLHLRDSPWIDGPGRTILETARHIDSTRVEYHIGAFTVAGRAPHPLVNVARSEGLNVHEIADSRGVRREIVDRVVALIDRHKIDVLHSSEFRSNVLALLCRRRRKIKVVTTAHGWIANDLRGKIYRAIDKRLFFRFDAVVLVSEAMRSLLPRSLGRANFVHTIKNALALDKYGAGVAREHRITANGDLRVLNIGRLSPEKGQTLLLRAFADVVRTCPRMRLEFAGTGPEKPTLNALAAHLGIADRVRFLGYVQDMPALYSTTALVVQSSLTEGMPNVILEAAYLKVPIIATDVGGTREVIEHSVSGWLIPPGSVAAIAEALRRYDADPAGFEAMAQRASATVAERFSFATRTEALTRVYEALFR